MWLPLAFLSAVFAALVAIFGKVGLDKVDSTVATAVRAAVMAVFMVGVILVSGKLNQEQFSQFSGKDWIYIILAGISGALSWIFYFLALKIGDAGKVASIDRLSLVFVVIFAAIFLSEKLKWYGIIGVISMVFGAILISL